MRTLTLITVTGVLAIAGCDLKSSLGEKTVLGPDVAAKPAAVAAAAASTMPVAPPVPPSVPPGGAADVLLNEFGIERKVIVVARSARCVDKVIGGQEVGQPLRSFAPAFVFEVYPTGGSPAYFRIGSTPHFDSIIGWVGADQAAEWNTRIAQRHTSHEPLLVYATFEQALESVRTPQSVVPPMARFSGTNATVWMPWPQLERRSFEWLGTRYECARLLFLAEARPSLTASRDDTLPVRYSTANVAEVAQRIHSLAICFVIDNTKSTEPHLAAMKQAVETICRQLSTLSDAPDVRFSLVLYRDYVRGLKYRQGDSDSVVYTVPSGSDHEAFLAKLSQLRVPTTGSGGWSESVYDGVDAGLDLLSQEDPLATRMLVLIGDNSAHEPGTSGNPRNLAAAQLIDAAKARQTTLYSLCVPGGGGEPERILHREQFERLAVGTGGACFPLEDAVKIATAVTGLFEQQRAAVDDRRSVVHDLATGDVRHDLPSGQRDSSASNYTAVMDLLAAAELDPERLRQDGPACASGWVVAKVGDQTRLQTDVYVSRTELDLLLSDLSRLCAVLSADVGLGLLDAAVDSRAGELFPLGDRRARDPFQRREGLGTATGLIGLSPSQIKHMSETERLARRKSIVEQIIPAIQKARNDDRYFRWTGDIEYGFVDERVFP